MSTVGEFILFLPIVLRGLLSFLVVLTNHPLATIAGFAILGGFMLVFIYVVRRGRNQRDRG